MEIEQAMSRVESILNNQYGVSLLDVGEEDVRQALLDGEEPQAIADDLGEKYGSTRNAEAFAKDHIESSVLYWRELMVKTLGQVYADAVSDESIRQWLLKGEEPTPIDDEDENEMIDDLAQYIEDNL